MPLRLTALALLALILGAAAHSDMVFTRAQFDELDHQAAASRKLADAPADAFAWGEAYVLRGYIEMYLATGDADYLRRLVTVGDQIIETRDDRKAARQGKQDRALWSLGGSYTVARLTLKDAQGRDAIGLRSIRYAYNDQTQVSVQPGPQPGAFSLTTSNAFWVKHLKSDVTFENLSLDPASPRYFERLINDPQYVSEANFQRNPQTPASVLLVATDLRKDKRADDTLAALATTALVPSTVQYYGYIGPIFSPLTRFATLVLDHPELQAEFKPAAQRYITAAAESIAAYDQCWRNGPAPDEGYYLLIDKGADFWCDGIMAPWNYMGATGQVICNLWDWTQDPQYRDKLTRLATFLKRDCTLLPNGGYSFPYWSKVGRTGWTRDQQLSVNTPEYGPTPKADDLSHAALEVEFAVMCHERDLVFDDQDMRRFAKTFVNMWNPEKQQLARDVDGSGAADEGYAMAGARWLELARWDPQVFTVNETLWSTLLKPAAYGHALGNYARMYHWQETLKGGG